jgi:hypothetical protein
MFTPTKISKDPSKEDAIAAIMFSKHKKSQSVCSDIEDI